MIILSEWKKAQNSNGEITHWVRRRFDGEKYSGLFCAVKIHPIIQWITFFYDEKHGRFSGGWYGPVETVEEAKRLSDAQALEYGYKLLNSKLSNLL